MDRKKFAGLCYRVIDCFKWLDYYEGKDQTGDIKRMSDKQRKVLEGE